MTRNKLYLLLSLLTVVSYSYLWHALYNTNYAGITPCVFKRVTGIACPSCGSTRSVVSIIKGNFKAALLINPLGIIIALLMLAFPLWLVSDVVLKKDSLYNSYIKTEKFLQKKYIAIPLIVLILANWVWNIFKDL